MTNAPRIKAADLPPGQLVERMLSLSLELKEIVDLETSFLSACEPLRIIEVQERKTRLANAYAMDVQEVAFNKGLIDRVPAEKVVRLKSAMSDLRLSLNDNEAALNAAKSVSQRILKSVADHVGEKKAPALAYGRDASISRSGAVKPAAIALDEHF